MTSEKEILLSISNLINFIGDDSNRLKGTPQKVLDIFRNNVFSGYYIDIPSIFSRYIEYVSDHEQMILLRDIPFLSFCEHHFMPIIGKITLGYMPNAKIIGINRLHMLIAAHTKRLQIQERIISNIANDINIHLEPLFVGVLINSSQYCIGCCKEYDYNDLNSNMINSCFLGEEKEKRKVDFFNMIKG